MHCFKRDGRRWLLVLSFFLGCSSRARWQGGGNQVAPDRGIAQGWRRDGGTRLWWFIVNPEVFMDYGQARRVFRRRGQEDQGGRAS